MAGMSQNAYIPGLLKDDFLLDPSVLFFNHGSFGATPRPVFESYQYWQREMERQPVEFIQRRAPDLLRQGRKELADYFSCGANDIVFVQNATYGMNAAVRAIPLGPGDEVLPTNHEYGAVDRTWTYQAKLRGYRYINHPMNSFCDSPDAWVEELWSGVTANTRVIAISHITSPTALIFPVREVCQRARQEGILTVIDGAHAPGQLDINLPEIGADFYTGNLHKWLCAPKGAAFLYAHPQMQQHVEPLVVGWGYNPEGAVETRLVDYLEWIGTRDMAPFLAVPSALQYQREHNWSAVRSGCHNLAMQTMDRFMAYSGEPALSTPDWFVQMVDVPLPRHLNAAQLSEVFRAHKIEIPVIQWQGRLFLRLSIQAYTTQADLDTLFEVVKSQVTQFSPV
jgi:isopenicillin-N epimerase